MITKKCEVCRKDFLIQPSQLGKLHCCSRECRKLRPFPSGSQHPNWKGGTRKHSEGYRLIKNPTHQHADSLGYVLEHVLILEKHLGRYINPKKEHVHHIDGNKQNNKIKRGRALA